MAIQALPKHTPSPLSALQAAPICRPVQFVVGSILFTWERQAKIKSTKNQKVCFILNGKALTTDKARVMFLLQRRNDSSFLLSSDVSYFCCHVRVNICYFPRKIFLSGDSGDFLTTQMDHWSSVDLYRYRVGIKNSQIISFLPWHGKNSYSFVFDFQLNILSNYSFPRLDNHKFKGNRFSVRSFTFLNSITIM